MGKQIKTYYYPVILKPINYKQEPKIHVYIEEQKQTKLLISENEYEICSKNAAIIASELLNHIKKQTGKTEICFNVKDSLPKIIEREIIKYEVLELNEKQKEELTSYYNLMNKEKEKNAQ